jgi:hypothetical protein
VGRTENAEYSGTRNIGHRIPLTEYYTFRPRTPFVPIRRPVILSCSDVKTSNIRACRNVDNTKFAHLEPQSKHKSNKAQRFLAAACQTALNYPRYTHSKHLLRRRQRFSPVVASKQELQQHGFPPKPDKLNAPAAYSAWAKAVSAPQTRVDALLKRSQPTFSQAPS